MTSCKLASVPSNVTAHVRYDRRKAAAVELEKLVLASDMTKITAIIDQLCGMFTSTTAALHSRNGGECGVGVEMMIALRSQGSSDWPQRPLRSGRISRRFWGLSFLRFCLVSRTRKVAYGTTHARVCTTCTCEQSATRSIAECQSQSQQGGDSCAL